MIRAATEQDIDAMIDIWLQASRLAHSFIPYTFWLDRADDMRSIYLPGAESYVCVDRDEVLGFLSLADNHLAALFVLPSAQGRGHGNRLLTCAKNKRQTLSLNVYSQNRRAVAFYERAGFRAEELRTDVHSGHPERVMVWRVSDGG